MVLAPVYFYDIANESRLLLNGVVTGVNKLGTALASISTINTDKTSAESKNTSATHQTV